MNHQKIISETISEPFTFYTFSSVSLTKYEVITTVYENINGVAVFGYFTFFSTKTIITV